MISVIIPVYNTAKTLDRCFQSVKRQTYSDLDIILVDDGSTDISGDICERLAGREPRARVIHQANQGLSAARNAGLKITKGNYVTFVDSDDALDPRALELLHAAVEKYHTKIAVGSLLEIYPDGRQRSTAPESATPRLLSTAECLAALLQEDGFTMSVGAKLFRKSLFKTVQYPVGKLYEDVGTTYRLVLQAPEVAFVPLPLYHYYQNPGSITHSDFKSQTLDLVTLTDQMCDDLDRTYPDLKPLTILRRCHARFSILRQIDEQHQDLKKSTIKYLKQHQKTILASPYATRRDRLAMRSLQLGFPVFRLAWQLYSRYRH